MTAEFRLCLKPFVIAKCTTGEITHIHNYVLLRGGEIKEINSITVLSKSFFFRGNYYRMCCNKAPTEKQQLTHKSAMLSKPKRNFNDRKLVTLTQTNGIFQDMNCDTVRAVTNNTGRAT